MDGCIIEHCCALVSTALRTLLERVGDSVGFILLVLFGFSACWVVLTVCFGGVWEEDGE